MTGNYPLLAEDITQAPQIELDNGYKFHAFSFGERGTRLTPELVKEITTGFIQKILQMEKQFDYFDYIVTIVPGGDRWGLLVAHTLQASLVTILDQPTGLPDEFRVRQKNPLYNRDLFLCGFKAGDRVIFIDDVVSTGSTVKTVIRTLREKGVIIQGVFCIVTKGEDYKKIEAEEKIPIHSLMNLPS